MQLPQFAATTPATDDGIKPAPDNNGVPDVADGFQTVFAHGHESIGGSVEAVLPPRTRIEGVPAQGTDTALSWMVDTAIPEAEMPGLVEYAPTNPMVAGTAQISGQSAAAPAVGGIVGEMLRDTGAHTVTSDRFAVAPSRIQPATVIGLEPPNAGVPGIPGDVALGFAGIAAGANKVADPSAIHSNRVVAPDRAAVSSLAAEVGTKAQPGLTNQPDGPARSDVAAGRGTTSGETAYSKGAARPAVDGGARPTAQAPIADPYTRPHTTEAGSRADAATTGPTAVEGVPIETARALPRASADRPPGRNTEPAPHQASPTASLPPTDLFRTGDPALASAVDVAVDTPSESKRAARNDDPGLTSRARPVQANPSASQFAAASVTPALVQGSEGIAVAVPEATKNSPIADVVPTDIGLFDTRGGDRPFAPGLAATPVLARPETPAQIATQLAEVVRPGGARAMELTLQPEELGRVRMTMSGENGALSVALSVERPETLDLIRRHIDLLAEELRRLGYQSVDFTFHDGTGSQDTGTDESGQGAGQGTHRDAPGPEDAEAEHMIPSATRAAASRDGIDIRI